MEGDFDAGAGSLVAGDLPAGSFPDFDAAVGSACSFSFDVAGDSDADAGSAGAFSSDVAVD